MATPRSTEEFIAEVRKNKVIAVYESGSLASEYLYLGDALLAQVQSDSLNYLLTDHLMTLQFATERRPKSSCVRGGNPIRSIDPLGLTPWLRFAPYNLRPKIRRLSDSASDRWGETIQKPKPKKQRHNNRSSNDVPDRFRGLRPKNRENGDEFTKRAIKDTDGIENPPKSQVSDYSKLKKHGNRDYEHTSLPEIPGVPFFQDPRYNHPSNSLLLDAETYDPWLPNNQRIEASKEC